MITTATTPLHPDDRLALWSTKRTAYLNNESAVDQFATPDGQPHRERGNDLRGGNSEVSRHGTRGTVEAESTSAAAATPASPNFPQRRKQKWLTALAVFGNTLGGLLLFCAAFSSVVMIGFLMEQMK